MGERYLVRRWRSVGCAWAGLVHLVGSQANARVHGLATCLVIAAGWCWLLAAMGMVWVAEALNTAVELLADAVCQERHPLVGRAKDVAAGGVLVAAVCAVGIGVGVVVGRV